MVALLSERFTRRLAPRAPCPPFAARDNRLLGKPGEKPEGKNPLQSVTLLSPRPVAVMAFGAAIIGCVFRKSYAAFKAVSFAGRENGTQRTAPKNFPATRGRPRLAQPCQCFCPRARETTDCLSARLATGFQLPSILDSQRITCVVGGENLSDGRIRTCN